MYEPANESHQGRGNPDFVVHAPIGDVVCEVTELAWFPTSEQGGPIDSYAPIRRKLQDKHKQGRHLKGRFPYVVVLWFIPPHPAADLMVPGAMFGNVAISVPVNPSGGPPPDEPTRNIFTRGGRLQPTRLTTISAVGVLTAINPTAVVVEERIDKRLSDDADLVDTLEVVREEYGRSGYDPEARLMRMDTFHNIFAAPPRLARGIFAGPQDREFDVEGSEYIEVFKGAERMS
jgi:hypothetical protein